MTLTDLLSDARIHIKDTGLADGLGSCGSSGMTIMQSHKSKYTSCSVVDPLIGLVLQGSKAVQYGSEQVSYQTGDVIVIGHALPMISGLIDANPDAPFIALYIPTDMQVLRGVYSDMGGGAVDETGPALSSGPANTDIIDAISRLFRLRRDPIEEQALGSATLREVYFRVLRSENGNVLRRIIHTDSKANQVAKAISHIRKEYRNTIKASDLAAISGMSASVFYDTFKRITANSPLQFQKDLRLTEAHRMLQLTDGPVSQIAHDVGYESAAQFSREFSRKFGAPPNTFLDVAAE